MLICAVLQFKLDKTKPLEVLSIEKVLFWKSSFSGSMNNNKHSCWDGPGRLANGLALTSNPLVNRITSGYTTVKVAISISRALGIMEVDPLRFL